HPHYKHRSLLAALPREILMYIFRWVVSSELDMRALEQLSLVSRVYISKTSYIRQGEESLDGFYRAWHHVEYYRYLRFFPDGCVLMLTTPEDPLSKATEFQRNRFCRRNQAPEAEHAFHVGLHLTSRGRQSFSKLVWIHHSCHITYKLTGETVITMFDLDRMYTPFFFARVKSYTAFSEQPL
ncbi:hypothetical protein GOODEAATRI_025220, partial [Goodea atripinnis]